MLPVDELTLAIDLHGRSYKLLRWVAGAIDKGFIQPTRAHEYTNISESAYDWIDQHYLNFPPDARPERIHLRRFANFFGTYVSSSFDMDIQPGKQLASRWGCYCQLCAHLVNAPHLKTKKLTKRDKDRAITLMEDRLMLLAKEEEISVEIDKVADIVRDDASTRWAGYSAYGHWLIKRMDGLTDGKSVLALWRQIAWNRAGSPIKRFQLSIEDFVAAEQSLVTTMRSQTNSTEDV